MNEVQIIGNLGKEPEVRYVPNGAPIVTLTVASSESWKDKDGKWQEKAEWHRIVVSGKLAERIVDANLAKGTKLFVRGKIVTNKWQDKQTGQDRFSTEIRANEAYQLIPFKSVGSSSSSYSGVDQYQPSEDDPMAPF